MLSFSEENYLKEIFHISKDGKSNLANTNAIADKLSTKASSVTDMLKRLDSKSYLKYTPYQGVALTNKGKKCAIEIIRKHRLWEVFLVDKLHFRWDEIHEIAEELEHIKSQKLVDKLDEFLGYPQKDPHGDPIPTAEGEINRPYSIALNKLKTENIAVVVGVNDDDSSFLRYLAKIGIGLGSKIKIKELFSFDDSMDVILDDKKLLHLSAKVAENIMMAKKESANE